MPFLMERTEIKLKDPGLNIHLGKLVSVILLARKMRAEDLNSYVNMQVNCIVGW